jgi:hypothetical protein
LARATLACSPAGLFEMVSMNKNRRRSFGFAVAAGGLLAACSVDTSDVHFVPDSVLTDGGVANLGGVLNKAGSNGKPVGTAGDADGGEPSGGTTSTGGQNTAGKPAGGAGGMPTGGMPSAGTGGMGAGGGPPVGGYPCMARKSGKLLANFDNVTDPMASWKDASMAVDLGFYTYPPNAMPTIKLGDGTLTVDARGVTQPTGFGLWISPCINAKDAGFTSLRFTLAGSWTKGMAMTMRVAIHTNDTSFADPMFQAGGCVPPMGQNMTFCRPNATEVAVTNAMGPGTVIVLPFTAFKDGNPVRTVDPAQIKAVEWGFIYLNGDSAFNATAIVDDVSLE